MAYSFRQRFGSNGIYTDPRVLVPLAVALIVGVVGWGVRSPEEEVADYAMRHAERSLEEYDARYGTAAAPALRPSTSGPSRAELEATSAPPTWLPLAGALAGGVLFAGVGVVGALLLLRREPEDEAPAD